MEHATPRCQVCDTELGTGWRYGFEDIVMQADHGAHCKQCGRYVCKQHLQTGSDGWTIVCPGCTSEMVEIKLGTADPSMVEKAKREGRYSGPIRMPGAR